jgi:LmbE family N-acetylglucosaminyl deacetylase
LRIFALGCHPDDIEFMMAGTLFLLREAGCEIHVMRLANGSCGTTGMKPTEIVEIREAEGREAASLLGATYHESLVNDLEVLYSQNLIRRVTAVIRRIAPDIVLLLSPEDYMEDHMNASRIGTTAAFCRGMINYDSLPPEAPTKQDVTLYHALPYGLTDGLRRAVSPDFYVGIDTVMSRKTEMLACHRSQLEWLAESQGIESYLETMREMSEEVGRRSGVFRFAEGWRRRSHLGYSRGEQDPLTNLLGAQIHVHVHISAND